MVLIYYFCGIAVFLKNTLLNFPPSNSDELKKTNPIFWIVKEKIFSVNGF